MRIDLIDLQIYWELHLVKLLFILPSFCYIYDYILQYIRKTGETLFIIDHLSPTPSNLLVNTYSVENTSLYAACGRALTC